MMLDVEYFIMRQNFFLEQLIFCVVEEIHLLRLFSHDGGISADLAGSVDSIVSVKD